MALVGGVMTRDEALRVWNKERKATDPSARWVNPKTGTPEHQQIRALMMGPRDPLPPSSKAVTMARLGKKQKVPLTKKRAPTIKSWKDLLRRAHAAAKVPGAPKADDFAIAFVDDPAFREETGFDFVMVREGNAYGAWGGMNIEKTPGLAEDALRFDYIAGPYVGRWNPATDRVEPGPETGRWAPGEREPWGLRDWKLIPASYGAPEPEPAPAPKPTPRLRSD